MDGVLVPAVKLATFRRVIREAVDELRFSSQWIRDSYQVGDVWPPWAAHEEAKHNRIVECSQLLVWYERSSTVAADWISVEERLPDDGVIVQVFAPGASEPVWLGYLEEDGEWYTGDGGTCYKVTHWRELPAPPAVPAELESEGAGT